jgi:CHAT domain-containing protein/Tfp pilus assembly protein PilF
LKFLTLILLLFLSLNSDSQTIEETTQLFLEASEKGDDETIIRTGKVLIEYYREQKVELDTDEIEIRLHTATSLSNTGDIEQSLKLNEETYSLCKEKWGPEHAWTRISLGNLAYNYSSLGDYAKSKELNEQYLEIYNKIYTKEHPELAIILSNLASDYSNLGDFAKSKELNEQCLKLREKLFGKRHLFYARGLEDLAWNYTQLGDFDEAKKLNEQALKIIEKLFEKKGSEYAAALNKLGRNYADLGDYTLARDLVEEALKINKKVFGKLSLNYASSLGYLAPIYASLGDHKKSKELNEECLNVYEEIYGKEHSNYATCLTNLSDNYFNLGDYYKAISLSKEALGIHEKVYGKEHPYYALSLSQIARSYSYLGEYSKSLALNKEVLKITEKAHGKEHRDYTTALCNLASDYYRLRDFTEAIKLLEESLKIEEIVYGKWYSSYAVSLNNLALNYFKLGNYDKSLALNEEALMINEKIHGKKHPYYAMSLSNLALDYSKIGDHSKAQKLHKQAFNIRKQIFEKEHPDYVLSMNYLANNHAERGEYREAKELNEEALTINKKIYGNQHPKYAGNLKNIGDNHAALGNYHLAMEFLTQAYGVKWNNFTSNKFGLTSGLKTSSKKDLETTFHLLASLASIDATTISTINNYWINLNGVIGSDESQIINSVQNSADSTLIALFEDLKLSKFQLGKYNEMTVQDRFKNGIDKDQLEKDIAQLESKISKKSHDFVEMNRVYSMKDVKSALGDDEVLVDIARIPYYDFYSNRQSDSVKYLVFITDNSQDTVPRHLFISTGRMLEEEVFSNYSSFTSGSNRLSGTHDELSYNHFWKPIAEKIGDKKTVYVSLGGVYNNINLNTLYDTETNKYLFEEKDIQIVNSSRDFIRSKEQEIKTYTNQSAALFGYPDYDGFSNVSSEALTRDLDPFWIDSLSRGGMTASSLPETKTEVENISLTLTGKNWDVSTYLGDEASEAAVKELESPRVVHIATHGYFFEDIPQDKTENRFMGMDTKEVIQDPLLRSGLLFSGANKTLNGEDLEGENGLLSAYEAGLLNLQETELVVLSACETGRGEVKNSEGVYGLRKAISDAGAANTIMSLWKVDDKVTQEFMSSFYALWLDGKTIREAFNETQIVIKQKYPQPYYWGAFVLVGE